MRSLLIGLAAWLLCATTVSGQDAIRRSDLTPVGPGSGSLDFPMTTVITRVTFTTAGMEVDFGKKDGASRWPDGITPGWQGPLQYSVGFVVRVNDWWYANAPIENWHDRKGGTGPLQDQSVTNPLNPACMGQFQCNIFYDGRWDPLQTRRPAPGESIGVYVVSGDVRNNAYYGVQERSNIVLVQLPAPGQTAVFDFTGAPPEGPPPVVVVPPPVAPPPVVTLPPPPVNPPPAVPLDVAAAVRAVLNEELLPLERDTNAKATEIRAEVHTFAQQFGAVMTFVGKYIAPPIVAWIAARQMK